MKQNAKSSSVSKLDTTPAVEMTPDEFASHTLVVPVKPCANPSSRIRLEVVTGAENRIDELRTEVERVLARPGMADADLSNLVSRAITECLSIDLRDQMWASRLPNGKSLIFVKGDVYGRVPEREIVEFVHRNEVDAAVAQGRSVPAEIVRYYQSKPRQAANAGAGSW